MYHTEHINSEYVGIFTYLKPNAPIIKPLDMHQDSYTVSNRKTNRALEGDHVYYMPTSNDAADVVGIKQRAKHTRIVGVLQVTSAKRFGLTKRGLPIYNFVPLSWHYPNFMVASNVRVKQDQPKNVYMLVEFHEWTVSQKYPAGKCLDVLGTLDNMEAQDRALLSKNGIYTKRYPKIPAPAPAPAPTPMPAPAPAEQNQSIIAIDPEGSLDLDDAFHIHDDHIYVHIADVDATFGIDHVIEPEISKRLTSIYGQMRVYNMLPSEFSNNLISLNTHGSKNVITVVLDKQLHGKDVYPNCIKVAKALSYKRAQAILDGPGNNSIINKTIRKLSDITKQTDTHKMIEAIMVATNVYIGQTLAERRSPFLIRVMPKLSGSVSSEVLSYLKYRGAEGAKYTVTDGTNSSDEHGHGALNVSNYVHFTSPMRRYADLVTQRIIKGYRYTKEQLEAIAQRLNDYNLHVKRYYRDNTIMKLSHDIPVGKVHHTTGYIVDYNHETNYVFVYLSDYAMEYKYPLFNDSIQSIISVTKTQTELEITNSHSGETFEIPMFKQLDITLSVNPEAIRLTQRVILHISGLSELFF